MGFPEYFWKYSKLLTEFRAKLAAESRAKGMAIGMAAGGRHMLKAALASKFPGLEALPQLDKIKQVKTIENLLVTHVLNGKDPAAIKRAIQRAARQSATT